MEKLPSWLVIPNKRSLRSNTRYANRALKGRDVQSRRNFPRNINSGFRR
jgi:hypothetical protein